MEINPQPTTTTGINGIQETTTTGIWNNPENQICMLFQTVVNLIGAFSILVAILPLPIHYCFKTYQKIRSSNRSCCQKTLWVISLVTTATNLFIAMIYLVAFNLNSHHVVNYDVMFNQAIGYPILLAIYYGILTISIIEFFIMLVLETKYGPCGCRRGAVIHPTSIV